jgi:Heterokaryon incompatibility protein (HET)
MLMISRNPLFPMALINGRISSFRLVFAADDGNSNMSQFKDILHNRIWKPQTSLTPVSRLQSVKRWLDNCRSTRSRCREWQRAHKRDIPTRLIDVSGENPKLICPEAGIMPEYVALSHCWGEGSPLRTLKENLSSYMVMIEFNLLPKTFQDAITVTKTLGFEYLWIDSLSIIQNDPDDWQREASRMSLVYENASLTIAATWGANGDAGCFHTHIPTLNLYFSSHIDPVDGKSQPVEQIYVRPYANIRKYVNQAALNTRGWTLQEMLLSPRVVSFAEDQMRWMCASLLDSEDSLEFDDSTASGSFSYSRTTILYHEAEDVDMRSQVRFSDNWSSTVSEYSSRKLSYAKDKLAAIAGLTQTYQRIFGDEPLVGLWRGNLPRGLLWRRQAVHPSLDTEAVNMLNIPTWSWLKVKGQVGTKEDGFESLVTIQDCRVTWESLPMTSKIIEANITGHGKLFKILNMKSHPDETCLCRLETLELDNNSTSCASVPVYSWFCDQCSLVCPFPEELFCLTMFNDTRIDARGRDPGYMEISALIVTRMSTENTVTVYSRVGMMRFRRFPRGIFEANMEQDFMLI